LVKISNEKIPSVIPLVISDFLVVSVDVYGQKKEEEETKNENFMRRYNGPDTWF
jgi:hypothetical protein